MNPQVLVVSRDQMLLHTRQLILGAFFEVQGAGRVREAEALISARSFDLIILCYTLSASECRQVLELVADLKPHPQDPDSESSGKSARRTMLEPGRDADRGRPLLSAEENSRNAGGRHPSSRPAWLWSRAGTSPGSLASVAS